MDPLGWARAKECFRTRPARVGVIISNCNPSAGHRYETNPLRLPGSESDAVFIENVVLDSRRVTFRAPQDDGAPIDLVRDDVVGDYPITRECELRSRIRGRVVTFRPVHLNTEAQVVVKEIIRNREGRAVCVDAMVRGACTTTKVPIVVDLVSINQNPGTIPDNPKIIMVNPIPPNCEIMAVVYLHTLGPIPQLKPLNRDPADRLPITSFVLNKNAMKLALVDKVNNRELARNVEELDGSRRGAGFPELDNPFIVCPAPNIGRVPGDHSGRCIGHCPPRLGACAGIAIAPSRGDVVRRRLGRDGWRKGRGKYAGTYG